MDDKVGVRRIHFGNEIFEVTLIDIVLSHKQTYKDRVCIFQICIFLVEDKKWDIENWEY